MDRDLFLVLFLTFSLTTFLYYVPNFTFLQPYEIVIMFVFLILIAVIFNLERMAAAFIVLAVFSWLRTALIQVVVVEIHLAMFCLAMFFVNKEVYGIVTDRVNTLRKAFFSILHGGGLFLALLAVVIAFSIAVALLGFHSDSINVYEKVSGLPLYLLLFAVLFAPLSEELFFRAFLTSRYGVIVSSALFALSHVFYNSTAEIAGAFLIGLVLSYYFSKKGNLVACMIAHALFNLVSLSLMFLSSQAGA